MHTQLQSNPETFQQRQQITTELLQLTSNVVLRLKDQIKEALTTVQTSLQPMALDQLTTTLESIHQHKWLLHCSCLSTERISLSTTALEKEVNHYIKQAIFKKVNSNNDPMGTQQTTPIQEQQQRHRPTPNHSNHSNRSNHQDHQECKVVTLLVTGLSSCVCELATTPTTTTTTTADKTIELVSELAETCILWSCNTGQCRTTMSRRTMMDRIVLVWRQHDAVGSPPFEQSQTGQRLLSLLEIQLQQHHQRRNGTSWRNSCQTRDRLHQHAMQALGCSIYARSISTRGACRNTLGRPKAHRFNKDMINDGGLLWWLLDVVCVLEKNMAQLEMAQTVMARRNTTTATGEKDVATRFGHGGAEVENPCVTRGGGLLYSGLHCWTSLASKETSNTRASNMTPSSVSDRGTQKNEILRVLKHNVRRWMVACMHQINNTLNTLNTLAKQESPEDPDTFDSLCTELVEQGCGVFADASALLGLIPFDKEANDCISLLAKDVMVLRSKLSLLLFEIVRVWWCGATKKETDKAVLDVQRTLVLGVVSAQVKNCSHDDVRVLLRSIEEVMRG